MSDSENTPKILILPEDWYCFACGSVLDDPKSPWLCPDCIASELEQEQMRLDESMAQADDARLQAYYEHMNQDRPY